MAGSRGTPIRAFAILLLAAGIGTAGGLLGAGFQNGINLLQQFLAGPGESLSDAVRSNLTPLQTVLVPTVGGVLAGLLLLLVRHKRAPFGISDLIGLVALRQGGIRVRESVAQILSSACTIGSGGSIGREAANSQIAATVAAWLARLVGVSSRNRSVLLGCGVAAGMACSYNAPIAGAIFVMEAMLGNFAMDVFAPIVVSSVLATMLRQALIDEAPIYGSGLPERLNALEPHLVLAALLLGALCGLGGILFRRSLQLGRKTLARLPLPKPLLLGLGGLGVGIIGLWRPETWGNGFEVISSLTDAAAAPTVGLVLSLFVWKVAATVLTIGSGGLGGIFTPNLVVGAAFGALFAAGLELAQPGTAAAGVRHEQITFTFVGMAGLTAALTHAPITAVVLVFELTRHYELVLPLMLCSITASVVARMIDEDSYYSENLRAKGQIVPEGIEELALRSTYVRDVMRTDAVKVRESASFDEVMEILASHRGETLYVVDGADALLGRIDLHDVKTYINDPTLSSVVIATDVSRPAVAVTPDESLVAVLARFDDPEVTELAVAHGEPRRLLGRVTRQDVLAGISDEVLGGQRRARLRSADHRQSSVLELPAGWQLARRPVPQHWQGLALDAVPAAELEGLTVVMLVRHGSGGAEERLPAAPELVLAADQELLVIGRPDAIARLRSQGPQ